MSERETPISVGQSDAAVEEPFERLLGARTVPDEPSRHVIQGAVVGRLVGFLDNGETPLVTYTGQPVSRALAARSTLDLHGAHIGREAVLLFEDGDPCRPLIVGCLHPPSGQSLFEPPGQIEVDQDGRRMIVSARDQIVLRCGKASITLTRTGKIIIEGSYVSNRSSGLIRIKGGSVQIN
jgi:hypothetical protein